ncbi:MAG: hypothetical protein RLY87_920 [Chloroflexota bacterium]|jgi:hypothetical protein
MPLFRHIPVLLRVVLLCTVGLCAARLLSLPLPLRSYESFQQHTLVCRGTYLYYVCGRRDAMLSALTTNNGQCTGNHAGTTGFPALHSHRRYARPIAFWPDACFALTAHARARAVFAPLRRIRAV